MATTQMLSDVITDSRAWTAESIDDGASWRYTLTPACFAELDAFLAQRRGQSLPTTEVRIESADFPACAALLADALTALESGRGFAIVEQDMYPAPFDKPLPIAKRTRAYLREIGMG